MQTLLVSAKSVLAVSLAVCKAVGLWLVLDVCHVTQLCSRLSAAVKPAALPPTA